MHPTDLAAFLTAAGAGGAGAGLSDRGRAGGAEAAEGRGSAGRVAYPAGQSVHEEIAGLPALRAAGEAIQ